ncbi:MAG: ribonuclease HI [Candidatus Thiodiazotropha sp. DIVDIV]
MTQIVELFSDGACKGNPGPGGWGVVLRYAGQEKRLHGGEPDTTNNRMELLAVIRGLQELTRASRVQVTTDSQYVKNGITQWIHGWKRNGWKTSARKSVKNADLWRILDSEVSKHEVDWQWVKGHAGHPGNELADELANMGVQEVL